MHLTTSTSNNQLASRLAFAAMLALLVTSVTPVFAQLAITCPADITVPNDQGLCSAVVDYPAPIVTGSVGDPVVTCTPASGSAFPVGTNEVICAATDILTNQASCSFTITVEDTEPPVITDVTVSKSMLWPPNHKLVKVAVNYQDSDNCDSSPICTLSVTSNEAENGQGDGHTSQDWKVLNAHKVKLRAERSGRGDGRIYTITITCTDESGNAASEDVTVLVPHCRGRGAGSQGNNRGGNGKGHGGGKGRGQGF
jgi:HYR domain